MALEDKDILNAVFNRFSDQPVEFIMAQYEIAKRMNMDIERRLSERQACEAGEPLPESVTKTAAPEEEKAQEAPKSRKPDAGDLVCKPEEAITDAYIKCCLCGKESSSLTSRHLAQHGISVEEYKQLCGYAEDQKLMSGNFERKMRHNVQRAQQARMKNLREKEKSAS
ncbi:MAG TPA: MucR family transcriptional regulator [Candidatus Desulfovibrio gallistercoris]|nr:MucR family transcriptional regulator [Candidatus Desulfovibrio gallistercoris]